MSHNNQPAPETQGEFTERFVARVLAVAGPSFDDGSSTEEYAREVAPSYWVEESYRDDGPEACADGDMSYWGEG